MLPSSGLSVPRTSVVWYPRSSSSLDRVIAWIAGPPMLSREMMRTTRRGSVPADTSRSVAPGSGAAADGAPVRRGGRELDVDEAGGRHHRPDLVGGEPLLEPRAEAVERVGAHRVEAAV